MSLGYEAATGGAGPALFVGGNSMNRTLELSVAVLAGRPDLSDEAVIAAIRERLAFDGRTGPDPEVVAEAARLGKRKALAYLRKLVLPAPKARLAMPVQPILRSHLAASATRSASPALPAGN